MKCGFYSPWDATDASMTILSQLAMFFVLQAMQLVFNFVWTSLPLLDGNFGCVVCMYLWWSAYVKVVIITFVCSINFNLLFLFMLFLVYQNTHTYPNTHSLHMCRNMPWRETQPLKRIHCLHQVVLWHFPFQAFQIWYACCWETQYLVGE